MNFFRTRKKDILLIGLFYLINFGLWELIAPFVSNKWASFLVYLILFLLVIILFSKEMRSAFVRMKQEKLKERKYYVSLLLWLLLNLLIGALLLWLAAILDLDILPKNNENVESQISTIPVVFAVIQGCFFAPVIEEMTFRYAMIEKSGNTCLYRASIVASIVLFDCIHITRGMEFFYYLLPAIILTLFYVKNRNVWASIMLHSLINLVGYILLIAGML